MRCDDVESIERIFHEQNFINLKNLMKKAQNYMRKCPSGIHPKHYMTTFMPLASDEYRKFENFQKNLINSKNVSELDALRSEQKILDQKLAELESFERSMETKLESCLIDEEYAKRLRGEAKVYLINFSRAFCGARMEIFRTFYFQFNFSKKIY
jgi:hypothetical protein